MHTLQLWRWLLLPLLFCLLTCSPAHAQLPDSVALQGVTIQDFSPKNTFGLTPAATLDSATQMRYLGQPLSQALQALGVGYVRGYGPAGLATLNLRGGSANQTAVLWEGIPINSPLLGLTDFSQMPLLPGTHIRASPGGDAALSGSQAINGVISLEIGRPSQNASTLSATANSAQNFTETGEVSITKKRSAFTLQLANTHALNHFRTLENSSSGFEHTYMRHAQLQNLTLAPSFWITLPKGWVLSGKNYASNQSQELPPAEGILWDDATQKAINFRSLWLVEKQANRHSFRFGGGYKFESYCYASPKLHLNSLTNIRTFFATASYGLRINAKLSLNTDGYAERNIAQSDNFLGTSILQNGNVSTRLAYLPNTKLTMFGQARLTFSDFGPAVTTYRMGGSYKVLRHWSAFAELATTFGLPTLNDRFYQPGGNAKLVPERGKLLQGGMKYDRKTPLGRVGGGLTFFGNRIAKRILWRPGDTTVYWQVTNADQTQSTGFELMASWSHRFKQMELSAYFNGTYSKAKVWTDDRGGAWLPLPYVPQWQGAAGITLAYRKLNVSMATQGQTLRSLGYVSTRTLPAFCTLDVGLGYHTKLWGQLYAAQLQAFNLTNTNYRLIEGRPQPLANYQLSLYAIFH